MRIKLFIVLVVLAAAVLVSTQAFAGKPPTPGTADPQVVFRSSWEKISVANADGSNVTTVASARKGQFHKPLMFPGRRAILYHYEYPWLTRTLKITEFDVTNGVITVGATTDLGNVGAYAIHPDGTRIAFFDATGVTIHELNLATGEVRHLFDLPSGHHFHLFGGYVFDASALVLIVYDEESLYDYDSIMVIDLDASGVGVGAWEALDLAGFGNKLMGIEPAKTSRAVLFDAMNVLYLLNLDTLSLTTVGPGHMGTWAPDDSAVIYIDLTNVWTFGPASKIDLLTGEISPFTNPRTSISEPHWR